MEYQICAGHHLVCPREFASTRSARRAARACAVNELVEELGFPQPTTSKHLKVLRQAGLVRVRKEAQRRIYMIDPAPMAELDAWLAPYRRLWNERLDALGRHLDNPKEN